MNKMSKNSMYNKLTRQFILLIVLPVFLISILLNKYYTNVIIQKNSQQVEQNLQQLALSIEEEIKNISLAASTLAHDKELNHQITQWKDEESSLEKLRKSNQIISILNYLFNYNQDVESIVFFFEDEGVYTYKKNLRVKEEKVRDKEWYKKALEDKEKVINIGPTENILVGISNRGRGLSVAISPVISNNTEIEVIYIMFKTSIFDTIYERFPSNQVDQVIISNEEGEIIIASNESLLGKPIKSIGVLKEYFINDKSHYITQWDQKKVYLTTYSLNKYHWNMFYIKDYDALTHEMKNGWITFICIFIAFIWLFIAFIAFTVKQIIGPINELVIKMKSVEKGNFDDEILVTGTEEIIHLGQSYNNMIKEIKTLMVERDLKEKQRSNEEIRALQAQINPHFIYNTLNSIRLMAMMAKANGIKNLTDAFMKLLSLTFKSSQNLITVREEIEGLKQYIHIMKIRYGDHFIVRYSIDPDIDEFFIIKLILQPLVENAITHGIANKGGEGRIVITGKQDNHDLVMEVIDNGIGINQQKVKTMLEVQSEHKKSFNQIGIYNVDKRLKLNFGNQYGLTIKSRMNRYTKIIVRLPRIEQNTIRSGEGE